MDYKKMLLLQDIINNQYTLSGTVRIIFKLNKMVVSGNFIEESKIFETQLFLNSSQLNADYIKFLLKDGTYSPTEISSEMIDGDSQDFQEDNVLSYKINELKAEEKDKNIEALNESGEMFQTIMWDLLLYRACQFLLNEANIDSYFYGKDLPEKTYNLHFIEEVYEEYNLPGDDTFTPLSLQFID